MINSWISWLFVFGYNIRTTNKMLNVVHLPGFVLHFLNVKINFKNKIKYKLWKKPTISFNCILLSVLSNLIKFLVFISIAIYISPFYSKYSLDSIVVFLFFLENLNISWHFLLSKFHLIRKVKLSMSEVFSMTDVFFLITVWCCDFWFMTLSIESVICVIFLHVLFQNMPILLINMS